MPREVKVTSYQVAVGDTSILSKRELVCQIDIPDTAPPTISGTHCVF
jgi:hypothetical protein